jgi:hypothetical protein
MSELHTDVDELLSDCRSYINQDNADAREAFKRAMRGRAYGWEACIDAWNWFLSGWDERGGYTL